MEYKIFNKIEIGDLVRIILKESLYLVPMHGWFSLEKELGDFSKNRYNGDVPQIKEITGYIAGGGLERYQINPFGRRSIQLTESEVYSTGIRMGDIIVYKKDIERLEKL